MDAIESMWAVPHEALTLLGLMSTRLVMCMTVAPVLTPPQTPWILRTGIAVSLVLPMLVPAMPADVLMQGSTYWILALTLKEAAVGLFIGFVFAIPVWIAEAFGILFDNERGAMTGGTFNPLVASPSPIGALLQYFAILAILSTASGEAMLDSIAWTFDFWRPDDLLPAGDVLTVASIIELFNGMAKLTLLYFLPMLALLMLLEFGLALISVYAPSLQAFQMAMPVKSYAGLVMLLAALGLFWTLWLDNSWEYFIGVPAVLTGRG